MKRPSKIDPLSFPDHWESKGRIFVPTTMYNVEHMLQESAIRVRYDRVKKAVAIEHPYFEGCTDLRDNSNISLIVSVGALNGLNVQLVERYTFAIAAQNEFCPVQDWVISETWDGIDRLGLLFETIKTREGFPESLKRTLMHKWLLSAIAAIKKDKGFATRGVLTLQSDQSKGKTRWVAALVDTVELSNRFIKLDHHLDGNNKDSILSAIRHWLCEIGELDSSFKKDVARLKGFITADSDKVRQPYDRMESEFPRRTVFAATVNDENFLVDPSGNTRWWTIPCVEINYEHGINMQQLWRQLYDSFDENSQWWLTKEEQDLLEAQNSNHRAVSTIRDRFMSELDLDAPMELYQKKSASEALRQMGIENPSNKQAREAGGVLRELFGQPSTSKGLSKWLVPPCHGDFRKLPVAVSPESLQVPGAVEPKPELRTTAPRLKFKPKLTDKESDILKDSGY